MPSNFEIEWLKFKGSGVKSNGILNSVLLTYSILQVVPWHLIFNFIMSRDEATNFNCQVVNRNTLQVNLISIYVSR